MRILLTSGASYAPARGGSTRSNLAWLYHLGAAGHTCRVICSGPQIDEVVQDGITIVRAPDPASILVNEIVSFAPDWVLVSSEDVSQRLLRAGERAAPGCIVYLAHTPQFFPFGPESWNPDPEATRIVQRAAGVVAIGNHMAQYIQRYCETKPRVIHPPIYGPPPFARFDSFDRGLALMINPCAVKGIRIFLHLAEAFPGTAFGALIGWGTTSADRRALQQLPNVRILETAAHIEDILSQARLLLMPSLWYEGFGLIVMEAMLRAIPVIASDSGGLLEAKAGTDYVIPVAPILSYQPMFDENHMPAPIIPPQNMRPWEEALRTLTNLRAAYDVEAETSRQAALRFVEAVRPEAFEGFLQTLPRGKDRLTPAQRALLARRLLR